MCKGNTKFEMWGGMWVGGWVERGGGGEGRRWSGKFPYLYGSDCREKPNRYYN